MFCIECGKEIPDAVKFCPDCGASQIAKVEEKAAMAKPKKKVPKKEKPDYSKMTVAELKEKLNKAKLPTDGNKTQLIRTLENPDSKDTYKRMSTNQLKNVLRRKKLPSSGPKWQLLERLTTKNWKKNEKKHHNSRKSNPIIAKPSFTLVYIASLLIPVAGIIIGAVYLTNENEQTKEAGTNCLMIAILSIVAYWFFVINLFL